MKTFQGYRLITPDDLHWRPSNLMRIPNADFLERTGSENLGARLWRLPPQSANTLHKHIRAEEVYFVLEGTGRLRVGDENVDRSKIRRRAGPSGSGAPSGQRHPRPGALGSSSERRRNWNFSKARSPRWTSRLSIRPIRHNCPRSSPAWTGRRRDDFAAIRCHPV